MLTTLRRLFPVRLPWVITVSAGSILTALGEITPDAFFTVVIFLAFYECLRRTERDQV